MHALSLSSGRPGSLRGHWSADGSPCWSTHDREPVRDPARDPSKITFSMAWDGTTLLLPNRVIPQRAREGGGQTLRLIICRGPDAERTLETSKETVVVGRAENADVRLSDLAVSQFHLQLTLQPEGVHILDLGSRNGTWFSGARLERGLVPLGSVLSLGESALQLQLGAAPQEVPKTTQHFGHLVGKSPSMLKLYPILLRLAETELSVMLQGPTGSGKEEIARALHAASRRAGGPFVVLDCTVLPESLAASMLFGHEKGAFTGATDRRIGLFEAANGGVLFIDEVGDLPPSIQPMFLRALQSREVTPVGASKSRRIDIRIIGATWRDLRAMVNQGTFREDLYYRLAEALVPVPSLAERAEDIPALVEHFLAALPETTPGARSIAPDALEALASRPFPGNVRELRATVQRLAQLAGGPTITLAELQMETLFAGLRGRNLSSEFREGAAPSSGSTELPLFKDAKRTAVDEFERHYLQILLSHACENITRAASLAGLERHNLRALLRKHDLYRGD